MYNYQTILYLYLILSGKRHLTSLTKVLKKSGITSYALLQFLIVCNRNATQGILLQFGAYLIDNFLFSYHIYQILRIWQKKLKILRGILPLEVTFLAPKLLQPPQWPLISKKIDTLVTILSNKMLIPHKKRGTHVTSAFVKLYYVIIYVHHVHLSYIFNLLKNFYILGSSKFFRRSSTTVTDTFKRSTASIKRKLFFNSGTFNSNGSVVHNRPLALKASEINSQDCEIAKRLSKQILLQHFVYYT